MKHLAPSRNRVLRHSASAVAVAALASVTLAGALSSAAQASAARPAAPATAYQFRTLDNANDLTFNQLLGMNNEGVIAGYFGSGAQGHPNKGYRLLPPGSYVNENFPGSVQTQVTGLNDRGVTVGFWSGQNTASQSNDNFGFYAWGGRFRTADFPTGDPASPPVDQLLGVNDSDVAVGFFTNGQGDNRGYEYNIGTGRFSRVLLPGLPNMSSAESLTATAINNAGSVAGFYSLNGGTTYGFLLTARGQLTRLAVPGASMTQPFGVNDLGEVVGAYMVGSGSSATSHGFTWTRRGGFQTVDDPHGIGATVINGVNDHGQLVGFYTDSAGNTDGMLATP